MVDLTKQNELFLTIGRNLKKKRECFLIGGSAMMYYGVKEATKDIDIVFLHKKDRDDVLRVLDKLGFSERATKFILYHKKKNIPMLMELGESRIDLFLKKIISFEFTDDMVKRVHKVLEYENLIVKVVSLEDIILLKCATERAGDRIDVKAILEKVDVNWDYIIDESIKQTGIAGDVFPVYLYDFLTELKEDLKADIPNDVIKKIRNIAENEMVKVLRKK